MRGYCHKPLVPSTRFPPQVSLSVLCSGSRGRVQKLRSAGGWTPKSAASVLGVRKAQHLQTPPPDSRRPPGLHGAETRAHGAHVPRGRDPDQARGCPTADLFPDPKNNKQCFVSGVLPPTTATRVDILLCQWHTRQVTARGSTCPVGGQFHLHDVRAAGGR